MSGQTRGGAPRAARPGEQAASARLERVDWRPADASGDKVVFFKLARKFVDDASSVPADAADVLYYTLSVGHHTGVIDCFERALEMPLPSFERIVSLVEDEGARFKLQGVSRFGEIEIDAAAARLLLPPLRLALSSLDVFNEPGKTRIALSSEETASLMALIDLLLKVRDAPALYVTARRAS